MRRLKWTRSILLVLVAAMRLGAARAEERGDVRASVHVFAEPASSQPIVVITPAVTGRADVLPWLNVSVGWTADVVTGATPRVYGSPDVVTAATSFSDVRSVLAASVTARKGPASIVAGYHYGFESDYRSHFLHIGGALDLFAHNTTIAATYGRNFDSVCDLDNGSSPTVLRQSLPTSAGCFSSARGLTSESLSVDSAELSVAQTLTRRLVASLTAGLEHLDGFQSNPYRRVRLLGGSIEAQESHPRLRDRFALGARVRLAVRSSALGLDARLYQDSWAIRSVTAEGSWETRLLDERLRLRLRARFYVQSRAAFYRDAGAADSYEKAGPPGTYFTGDREMAPLADVLLGGRAGWTFRGHAGGRLDHLLTDVEVALALDLVKVIALTPLPPDAPRTVGVLNALLVGISATGRF